MTGKVEEPVAIPTSSDGGSKAPTSTSPSASAATSQPSTNPLKRSSDTAELPMISKSQLKKLKRKAEWEEGREARKVKRKEKMQQKRARRRADYEEKHAQDGEGATDAGITDVANQAQKQQKPHVRPVQLPITFIFDCQFDDLMKDPERVSLGSQLTRSYSDNKKAPFRAHLALSSFGGQLKERFEGILESHHLNWNGVRFMEEDFMKTAEQAKNWMKGENGGKIAGALAKTEWAEEAEIQEGEVIYLSSDSPDTLTELKPYNTYIIGALVDKNRHKGICYKKALEAGVKTARLPIGEYLQMQSRKVLTTNHVNEIMLKWLELGDWGEAFIQVIPKRKGGELKGLGTQAVEQTDELVTTAPDDEEEELDEA